ncbi:MAG: hypothetical protein H8M99_10150 [Gloeobacteraceae cyanobacterium ES-bin-144]|nr:hypothetical protein [Verrucomicrobiales bacterium]
MIRKSASFIAPLVFALTAHAGEIAVEQRPFTIEKSFIATTLPLSDCTLLQLEPKSWPEFEITEITKHGKRVTKGEVLVRFDAEDIEKKIADTRRALDTSVLSIAQAELLLKNLQETAPHKLDSLRRAATIAKEENTYFTQTRRKAASEAAMQALEKKKQILSNQQEELRQLTKMYAADDITEETEEIILTRQKDAVATAEFALRMETLDCTRSLEVTLPRESIALSNNERDAAITLRKEEEETPRAIDLKKADLETLKISLTRSKEMLADLEHDRSLFDFKAPADGLFYHGPIENGRWSPGDSSKSLAIHGKPAPNRPFATFIPATSKSAFVAFLDEATARALKPALSGIATFDGMEDIQIPVTLTTVSNIPNPDGTYRADLAATWPKDFHPASGTTAKVRIISYSNLSAISLPTMALSYGPDGWTVDVKLADGKSQARSVKCGRVSKDDTEILSGLEVGQMVLTP